MGSLDLILTAAALIVGVMLLTGHGEIFMKGGNADVRKKLYDEKKMEKGCGVALILIGIISGIDMFTTSLAAKIGYIVVLLVIVAGLVYYGLYALIHSNVICLGVSVILAAGVYFVVYLLVSRPSEEELSMMPGGRYMKKLGRILKIV